MNDVTEYVRTVIVPTAADILFGAVVTIVVIAVAGYDITPRPTIEDMDLERVVAAQNAKGNSMLTIQIGRGVGPSKIHGRADLTVTPEMRSRTIEDVAGGIARDAEIVDGEIVVERIVYSWKRTAQPTKGGAR